jgi:nucleotide-binding universal stress UspA family protein
MAMKKILIPTDFSKEAQNAAEVASKIARKFNSELVFLHSIEVTSTESINASGAPSNFDSYADSMLVHESIQRANEEMTKLVNDKLFEGIMVGQIIKIGSPFNHIYEAVEEGVDFIIMGTKGASGLSEVLIGSNTEKVVRRARCPVLSVKAQVEESVFDSIVYATTMDPHESKVIKCLKDIQSVFNSKIYVVWVNTPNNFKPDTVTKPKLRSFINEQNLENAEIHVYNDVIEEDGIRHFTDDVDAGMIAMGTSSHTGLSRIIRGSIAEDMVNHAKRPVLTVSMKD